MTTTVVIRNDGPGLVEVGGREIVPGSESTFYVHSGSGGTLEIVETQYPYTPPAPAASEDPVPAE